MPYIQCHIAAGLSKQRKSQLVRDIVKVTNEAIGSDPKVINVLLVEHPAENMSISGRALPRDATRLVDGRPMSISGDPWRTP